MIGFGDVVRCGTSLNTLANSEGYTFDVVGWMDSNHDRHFIHADDEGNRPQVGAVTDLDDTFGLWVRAVNVNDNEDVHMFWVYVYTPFQDWAEWYVLIGDIMADHNLALA